jgi:hypothetical protein
MNMSPENFRGMGPALRKSAKQPRLNRSTLLSTDQIERGERRIDVLELLRIVEALKGGPRRVFADILRRRGG